MNDSQVAKEEKAASALQICSVPRAAERPGSTAICDFDI